MDTVPAHHKGKKISLGALKGLFQIARGLARVACVLMREIVKIIWWLAILLVVATWMWSYGR